MRMFFNQNPQFFFVTLVVIIALMGVYILLQHSKINELMVLLNIKTATVDQSDSRFLTDDDLAPASVMGGQPSAVSRIEVKDPSDKFGGYNWADKKPEEQRLPNPATFNAQAEVASGGGQT